MENIVLRLEAVATRLEKFEGSIQGHSPPASSAPARSLTSASTAAAQAVTPSPSSSVGVTGTPGQYDKSCWDAFMATEVNGCASAATALADEFQASTRNFVNGAREMVEVIKLSQQRGKPSMEDMQALVQPLADVMQKAESLTRGARTKAMDHNKAVAECLQSFAWITFDKAAGAPTPDAAIAEGLGSAEVYINRVIMQFRDTAPEHKVWALSVKTVMKKLHALAKIQFPMGLTWTGTGRGPAPKAEASQAAPKGDAAALEATPADAGAESKAGVPDAGADSTAAVEEAAAKGSGEGQADDSSGADQPEHGSGPAPPPPPPPPPPPGMLLEKLKASAVGADAEDTRGSLMSALNRGADVTSGLRKVTDDMKTKNQTHRPGMVKAPTAGAKTAVQARGPPRKELQQNRWQIENWVECETVQLLEEEVKRSHALYISNCVECVIQRKICDHGHMQRQRTDLSADTFPRQPILPGKGPETFQHVVHGKVNTIMLDGCKKVGLVFGSVVSSVELVNCTSCKVQCDIACPTLNIDKTDGTQVYLSQEAADAIEVITSKSSSMSVTVPVGEGQGEPVEHPVPEQFMSKIVDGKLVTMPVTHL